MGASSARCASRGATRRASTPVSFPVDPRRRRSLERRPDRRDLAMARPRLEIDQAFLDDPYGTLRRAREVGPVHDTEGGVSVFRYEDMRTLLSDGRMRSNFPEFLHAFGITGGPFYEWMAISPLNRDGAEHLRWRALMSRTFTPRSVERLRPFLHDAAHELIDAFAARGACEFMGEFADAFPSLGLCELIGVPREGRDRRAWCQPVRRPAHRRGGRGAQPAPGLPRPARGRAPHRAARRPGQPHRGRRPRGQLDGLRGPGLHRGPGVRRARDDEEPAG